MRRRGTGPDGTRSPGIVTLTVFDKPAGIDDDTFYGHWYGHQSPMSEAMQPRARYVRNAVVRAVTPGAPRYRAIVEEAWPSVDAPHEPAHVLRRIVERRAGRERSRHARQHEAVVRPRDDAELHAERVHPQVLRWCCRPIASTRKSVRARTVRSSGLDAVRSIRAPSGSTKVQPCVSATASPEMMTCTPLHRSPGLTSSSPALTSSRSAERARRAAGRGNG